MLENNQKELVLLEDLGMFFPSKKASQRRSFGLYKCFCGTEFKAESRNVKNGSTRSCGCLINKDKVTHNLTNHRLYSTWINMIQRCNNDKNTSFKDYGAIGISICNDWLDINNFIKDMDLQFKEGLTLDRKNNNLGYSKENCRWVNMNIQTRNTRKIRSTNASGYRGVSYNKKNDKWITQIIVNYKNIYLGSYTTLIEAAKAYDNYVIANNLEHTKNLS